MLNILKVFLLLSVSTSVASSEVDEAGSVFERYHNGIIESIFVWNESVPFGWYYFEWDEDGSPLAVERYIKNSREGVSTYWEDGRPVLYFYNDNSRMYKIK